MSDLNEKLNKEFDRTLGEKKELKVAMVIDNYKLPQKAKYWREMLKQKPEIERKYTLVREEQIAGPAKNVTSCIRYYQRDDT